MTTEDLYYKNEQDELVQIDPTVEVRELEQLPEEDLFPMARLRVLVPTTLYDQLGRVACVVYPDGHILAPAPSRVGTKVVVMDGPDAYEGNVAWDGAKQTEGTHTLGVLLSDQATKPIEFERRAVINGSRRNTALDEQEPGGRF